MPWAKEQLGVYQQTRSMDGSPLSERKVQLRPLLIYFTVHPLPTATWKTVWIPICWEVRYEYEIE